MDTFLQAWNSFAGQVLALLPTSPTLDNDALAAFAEYVGYINYFIPVGAFLTFLSAVLTAVGVYYLVMIILRWLKVIA